MTTRREFLEQGARTALVLSVPRAAFFPSAAAPAGFLDLHRPPDSVIAQVAQTAQAGPAASRDERLLATNGTRWEGAGVTITTELTSDAVRVSLGAPTTAVRRIQFRWRGDLSAMRAIMGDAWERGYGDLEWRGIAPDRVMPWYCATSDGDLTHAYGVRTGAKAFCFWQMDEHGLSLFADVRSGGVPLQLGARTLGVCDVVCRAGQKGESAFAALHAFCKEMCQNPRLPSQPLYGSNDWYWAYGKNSAETVMGDARHIVDLSPTGANRPYVVIDDGWQPGRGQARTGVGTWDRGNEKFPDMAGLAAQIHDAGAKPGIWMRLLQASSDTPDGWRFSRDRNVLDPTVPEVQAKIGQDIGRIRQWGFSLLKHDYSTVDLFGRYGSTMGSALMAREGWAFASGPGKTTAEVIDDLYRTIRTASGDALVIGCNTVSHLSAGHFDICRVGDDTSGTDWSRTRKMGVNTLAFRGAQHGTFYVADADCVGVTNAVPWSFNRQWLDLLARSGTMLFVSLAPDALGADQQKDLRAALALAAVPQPLGEPLDWQRAVYPTRWRLMGAERSFDWVGPDGAGG